ncbi:MAG: hypothetical protein ACYSTG_06105 [Planctomycetota bacterium]|jgi:hypothetical protein
MIADSRGARGETGQPLPFTFKSAPQAKTVLFGEGGLSMVFYARQSFLHPANRIFEPQNAAFLAKTVAFYPIYEYFKFFLILVKNID